jgi:hypothetical protein
MRLSSIGYEPFMFFLMCTAFDCGIHNYVIQLTTLFILLIAVNSILLDHSIGLHWQIHSIVLLQMPVLTRPMAKRILQISSESVSSVSQSASAADHTDISLSSSLNDFMATISPLPELIDQDCSSDSSSERDDFSSFSLEENFEISNFETSVNFETSDILCHPQHCLYNLETLQNLNMATDCNDNCSSRVTPSATLDHSLSSAPIRPEHSPPNQDSIMEMLHLISNQMVVTNQDLREQLAATELKFTQELNRIKQENDTFRQDLRAELQAYQSSNTMSVPGNSVPISSNFSNQPTSNGSTVASSTLLAASSSTPVSSAVPSSAPDFQTQMLTLLSETFLKLTMSTDSKSEWPKFNGVSKKI